MSKIPAKKNIEDNSEKKSDNVLNSVSMSDNPDTKAIWRRSKATQSKTRKPSDKESPKKKHKNPLPPARVGMQVRVEFPLWISVSEAAALGGVQHKTIRRAIKDDPRLRYRIVKDRYQIEFSSLINFLHKNTKLYNKLLRFGLGQYVERWKNF